MSSWLKSFLSPSVEDISIDYLPKVSENLFQLPIVETGSAMSVSLEVLDNLEILQSKSETVPPLITTLYSPQTPFACNMAESMAKYYTDKVDFLQDTQTLLPLLSTSSTLTHHQEKELLMIWSDFAENPEFLDKYGFIDWEPFQEWNQNYHFMQFMSCFHGILPMFNMIFTLLILMIPMIWILVCGLNWNRDTYMECIRCIGGENQMMCHVLGFMDNQNTFCFQNLFLGIAIIAIYGFQFYYNMLHTERFFRHLFQVHDHLRQIQHFFQISHQRMEQFQTAAQSLPSYSTFVVKMKQQQDLLQKTLQGMKHIQSESDLWHDGIHMGSYLNTYHSFHTRNDLQQLFQYCIAFHGYLDNMETLSALQAAGKVHCADFQSNADADKNNKLIDFYYPALSEADAVRNSLCLDSQILLTGPNASGKTTLIKSIALNILFSQQVGVGFYGQCRLLKPYRHFHSYMNIPDTSERDSLFEAESRRCKDILNCLEKEDTGAHLCIFDELFSGTNPKDATTAATSFMKYIGKLPHYRQIDFLLTTHYVDVCKNLEVGDDEDKAPRCKVTNYKMDCLEQGGTLDMTYTCVPGISEIQGAMYVLEKMEFPQEMISH